MRTSLPIWINRALSKERDMVYLRPAELPKGEQFETEVDVYERATARIVPDLCNRMPATANKIAACADGKVNCLLPICPICGRRYRRFFISECLRLYKKDPNGAQTATVYLEEYETGTLKGASLKKAHSRFRKQLERCGFGGAIVIGGTEVTYRHVTNDWLLHLHLLSLGAPEQAWDNLEQLMSKYGVHDPLRRKPVQAQDHIEQLSYIQKFHTYYRAGTPNGNNRARPFPLKRDQLCELASWACKHDFPDFTFCFGVKRRHGHFYLEAPKTKMPPPLPRNKLRLERDSARRSAKS